MTEERTRRSRAWSIPAAALAVTLASIVMAWFVNSISAQLDNLQKPGAVQIAPSQPPTGNLYRLSPIPPGADWTA